MEFELGQTYDGYHFLELLRKSQDGLEYRVHNLVAQRDELLKVLPAFVHDDQAATGSFLQEARILARLTHPHIIGFYAAQPIDGRMAMTTEWSAFVPLATRLGDGPLPCREALDAADQLLSALGCLHEQNVVHLDITPETILYSPSGSWKLTSFAKARVMNCVPLQGGASGNPRYISPEQIKGGTLDYRSDLYSFAAVLYEMLCGRPPFDLKSQFELMLAHVSGVPEPPSRHNPSLPADLDGVILRALGKELQDRWPSAAEFGEALRAAGKNVSRKDAVATISVEPELFGGEAETELTVEPLLAAADPVEDRVTEPVAAQAALTVEPLLAAAADDPVEDRVTEPAIAPQAAVTVEPVLAAAVDERVEDCVTESAIAPQAAVTVEPVLAAAVDERVEDCVTETVPAQAALTVEPLLAAAVDGPVDDCAADPVPAQTAVTVEPLLAAAVDDPVEDRVTEPVAVQAVLTIEPVLAAAVDGPVEDRVTESAIAPQAALTVEPLLAAAVDGPVEDCAADPVPAQAAVTIERVLAVAVDERVEDCVTDPVPAQAAVTVEPLLAAAVDEPVEECSSAPAIPPPAESVAEPGTAGNLVAAAELGAVPEPAEFVHEAAEAMTPPSAQVAEAVAVDVPEIPAPAATGPSIQANLWAAAAIVAQAAAVAPPPAVEPVTIVPVPEPVPTAVAAAAPAPQPAPAPEAPINYPIRALVAAQQPPDSINWIMFGSSAAFLAIVLLAIFFGMR